MNQVVVGDTDRQGSEAKLSVGPLRCQGDSKFAQQLWAHTFFSVLNGVSQQIRVWQKIDCSSRTPKETSGNANSQMESKRP